MSMAKWKEGIEIFAGDYIFYKSIEGLQKGFGVFVRFIEHPKFPLTKKKMLLKNTTTNNYWSITCAKNFIYYKDHVPKSENPDIQKIVEIILKN